MQRPLGHLPTQGDLRAACEPTPTRNVKDVHALQFPRKHIQARSPQVHGTPDTSTFCQKTNLPLPGVACAKQILKISSKNPGHSFYMHFYTGPRPLGNSLCMHFFSGPRPQATHCLYIFTWVRAVLMGSAAVLVSCTDELRSCADELCGCDDELS